MGKPLAWMVFLCPPFFREPHPIFPNNPLWFHFPFYGEDEMNGIGHPPPPFPLGGRCFTSSRRPAACCWASCRSPTASWCSSTELSLLFEERETETCDGECLGRVGVPKLLVYSSGWTGMFT